MSTLDARRDALRVHAGEPSLQELVEESGLTRVHLLAWRDLADPEAGGSEVHADKVAQAWAGAGLDVTMRTAAAPGRRPTASATVTRWCARPAATRCSPAPRCPGPSVAPARATGWSRSGTACRSSLPVWARCPRIVFLHHVHAEMWRMVLPPSSAKMGETIEFRAAPPFYRSTQIVTLSQSSRDEIIDLLHMPPKNVTVVPPGIDPMYPPRRCPVPASAGRRRRTAGPGQASG